MRAEDADRLSALDEQRLVLPKLEQRADERSQRFVISCSLAGPAVDHEVLRPLGDLGIEVVQQHPQRRLSLPGTRVERASSRRRDASEVAAELVDARIEVGHSRHESPLPVPRAAARLALSRSASMRRWKRHQLHTVATRKNPAPKANARRSGPPVAQATMTTTAAST